MYVLKSAGSSLVRSLTSMMEEIQEICKKKKIHLEAFRIPSSLNVVADALSRDSPLLGEWSLDPQERKLLFDWSGLPQIDLMATPFNRQVRRFISPFEHNQSSGVDVRMTNWVKWEKVYIFPPPAMIDWVLSQIAAFKGEVILISCLPPTSVLWKIVEGREANHRHLQFPPRQMVREKWVTDVGPSSEHWRGIHFSPIG